MNLCSNNHDEVCFEVRECPCCEKIKELEQSEETVSDLETEVKDLKAEIDDLNSQ